MSILRPFTCLKSTAAVRSFLCRVGSAEFFEHRSGLQVVQPYEAVLFCVDAYWVRQHFCAASIVEVVIIYLPTSLMWTSERHAHGKRTYACALRVIIVPDLQA